MVTIGLLQLVPASDLLLDLPYARVAEGEIVLMMEIMLYLKSLKYSILIELILSVFLKISTMKFNLSNLALVKDYLL